MSTFPDRQEELGLSDPKASALVTLTPPPGFIGTQDTRK